MLPTLHTFSLHTIAEDVFHYSREWANAISDPRQFLLTVPDEGKIIAGLEFYFAVLIFGFVLQSPFVLGQKADFGDKARAVASSVVGLVSSAVIAMSWHVAFHLLGGHASFGGTLLVYVYSGAPYIPLLALASLISFAGLPPTLQHKGLNFATAAVLPPDFANDPSTRKGFVIFGGLALYAIIIWSMIVQLRGMKYVHQVSGVRLFFCVVFALAITAAEAPFLKELSAVFNSAEPPPALNAAQPSAPPVAPSESAVA